MKTFQTLGEDNILAALIFILWSIGLVFLPIVGGRSSPATAQGLTLIYLMLHAVLFIFVIWLLYKTIRVGNKKSPGTGVLLHILMYIYVLVALATSLYFALGGANLYM